MSLRVAAAHLNHGLRGEESDRDEEFVRAMCERLGVALVVERAQGLDAGASNLEERAREIRHGFLNRAADSLAAERIALAHHADDQAETVLIRLMRGAGAAGMAAMAPIGPGRLIRPMLALTRAEIRAYLRERKIEFVEDSTNTSPAILRNRVRNSLIPMLEAEYSPGLSHRLVELSGEMRALDDLVSAIAVRELAALRCVDGAIDILRFRKLHPAVQPAVVRLYVAETIGDLRRIERSHIEAIRRLLIEDAASGEVVLPRGCRLIRSYNFLRISQARPLIATDFRVPLQLEGRTVVEAAGFEFDASLRAADGIAMPEDLSVALFDAAKVANGALVVRNFAAGDRVSPIGMHGRRKVHDIFVDAKLDRDRRRNFPIVTLVDEIAWIPGLARGRAALVTAGTETALRVAGREMTF